MLNWDALIPASAQHDLKTAGHWDRAKNDPEMTEQIPASDTQVGQDMHKKEATSPNKGQSVPVCPSEKQQVSHLHAHDNLLNAKDITASVPVVPLVPPVFHGVSSSTPENSAHGGGAAEGTFAAEKEKSRFLSDSLLHECSYEYPLNPAAVCLVVAACEKANKTPEEIGRNVLSLHRLAPAEQVRHWHKNCLAVGLAPWRVLTMDSPGEGKDCGMCVHLHSVHDYIEGDQRRNFRWACKLGYLILEYGRATERIMLAPPECDRWEKFYPGPWR